MEKELFLKLWKLKKVSMPTKLGGGGGRGGKTSVIVPLAEELFCGFPNYLFQKHVTVVPGFADTHHLLHL